MPRVPKYGQLKVATTALPGARRQAHETYESQGGPVGEAMAAFGATAARIGVLGYSEIQQKERERADDLANLETARRFNDLEHVLVYDEQNGILTKKGLEPHELRPQYMARFDEEASKFAGDLKSDKQRLYFEQQRIQRRSSIGARIDQHSVQQMDAYEGEQFKATMQSSVNAAIAAGADDLARVRQEFDFQDEAIAKHGARVGMSPAAQQVFRDELRAKVHAQVVDNLLSRQKDSAAKAYFEETRDAIAKGDPQAIERIQTKLEEGTRLGEAQRASDGILASSMNAEQMRAAAKAIEDPKVRQTTLELVEHELTLRDRKKREDHEALTLRGLNIAEQTGRWTAIPKAEWLQYEVGERLAIKNYLEDKARGVATKTDPTFYASMIQMANGINPSTGQPDPSARRAFQQLNPVTMLGKLSTSDHAEIVRLQQASRKNDQDTVNKLSTDAQNQTAMVNEALVTMGLPTNPVEPGKDDHDPIQYERINAFRRAVREAATRKARETGHAVTDPELQSIVDQLRTRTSTQRVIKKGYFNNKGPAFAFEVAQAQIDDVTAIPATERRLIEEALKASGLKVTDTEILRFFNLSLRKTRKDR
jgi:hypothetical protein